MAAPNPITELGRLDKLVRKGLPPVVLVMGPSDFFRSKAVERLLKAVPAESELRRIEGADSKASSDQKDGGDAAGLAPELQDLRGGGLFAATTFVVVRRGANWWRAHCASIAELVPKIVSGSGLLIEAAKFDKRKKAAATLVKDLTKSGAVFEFRDLYENPYDSSRGLAEGELCSWLMAYAKSLGVPLQSESALLLIAQVGQDPSELESELKRLCDQFGDKPVSRPLAPMDLHGKLTVSFSSTPFVFAEAVLSGDRQAAHRSLSALFSRGFKGQDGKTTEAAGLLPFTTHWLFGQFGTVYAGRMLLDQNVSIRDVPGRVGVRQFQDRFQGFVKRNSLARLHRGVTALHACQRKSRTLGEDPALLLERFLAQWFDNAPIETAEEFDL